MGSYGYRNRVLADRPDDIKVNRIGISNILHLWKVTVKGLDLCPTV